MVTIKSAVGALLLWTLSRGKPGTIENETVSALHGFYIAAQALFQNGTFVQATVDVNAFPFIPCLAMLLGYNLALLHPRFDIVLGAACVCVSSVFCPRITLDSIADLAEAKTQAGQIGPGNLPYSVQSSSLRLDKAASGGKDSSARRILRLSAPCLSANEK
ncbi:hypothetical protein BJ741DRAFT_701137 [Chytriomyces cf. hyalinus JEL632]|nr:hypothetical protein BJ741DRAFT_701137 [Chytriomyces cf. hyalinus JEL632]